MFIKIKSNNQIISQFLEENISNLTSSIIIKEKERRLLVLDLQSFDGEIKISSKLIQPTSAPVA